MRFLKIHESITFLNFSSSFSSFSRWIYERDQGTKTIKQEKGKKKSAHAPPSPPVLPFSAKEKKQEIKKSGYVSLLKKLSESRCCFHLPNKRDFFFGIRKNRAYTPYRHLYLFIYIFGERKKGEGQSKRAEDERCYFLRISDVRWTVA